MGNDFTKYLLPQHWRQDEPESWAPIKYDPQFGFEGRTRPLKVPRATLQEMDSINLEPDQRDDCAHIRIQYRGCRSRHSPFYFYCNGYLNELKNCIYEERLHDMKEFEREKRLNARERKLREQA